MLYISLVNESQVIILGFKDSIAAIIKMKEKNEKI